jgi:hypothetical protein
LPLVTAARSEGPQRRPSPPHASPAASSRCQAPRTLPRLEAILYETDRAMATEARRPGPPPGCRSACGPGLMTSRPRATAAGSRPSACSPQPRAHRQEHRLDRRDEDADKDRRLEQKSATRLLIWRLRLGAWGGRASGRQDRRPRRPGERTRRVMIEAEIEITEAWPHSRCRASVGEDVT